LASPDKKAFLLRLPPEVWAQLERNGQIEYLLREALARRTGSASQTDEPSGDQDTRAGENKSNVAKSRRGK
jgi:hypothetical protein